LKELGLVVYDRGFAARKFTEERLVSKQGFRCFVEDTERTMAALRGPVVARRVADELNVVVDGLIDVGF
jgi:hypothetical protein